MTLYSKFRFSRLIWLGTILSFRRNYQGTLLPYHECSRRNYITQRLKVVPSYIIGYWAGDYFQAGRVNSQRSLHDSTLNTTTEERPLSKAPNPQLLPGSLLRVCVHYWMGSLGWVKCRAHFTSLYLGVILSCEWVIETFSKALQRCILGERHLRCFMRMQTNTIQIIQIISGARFT